MRYYLMSLVETLTDIYTLFLMGYALLSWFPGAYYSRLGYWIGRVVNPLLRPLRGLNFQFFGLDFTIVVAIFLLNGIKTIFLKLIWGF